MAPKLQRKLTDDQIYESLANRLRRKRFAFFRSLLEDLPRPLSLLDVGGTESYWRNMDFASDPGVKITLLNVRKADAAGAGFESLEGDARDLSFGDKQFDVVFSNAVIEHVGTFDDQRRMANEVRRVGKRYFVQTPNRNFPFEVHFQFPFFQFLPGDARIWLLGHVRLGQYDKIHDREYARRLIDGVRLLNIRQMKLLFPESRIVMEKFAGLNKSIMAYAGWERLT